MIEAIQAAASSTGDSPADHGVVLTIALVTDGDAGQGSAWAQADAAWGGGLSAAVARPEFQGSPGSSAAVYTGEGGARGLVAGLGWHQWAEDPESSRPGRYAQSLRQAGGLALRTAESVKADVVDIVLDERVTTQLTPEQVAQAVGEGLALARYRFVAHLGATQSGSSSSSQLKARCLFAGQDLRSALTVGLMLGEAANHARKLASTPPNIASTDMLTEHCRGLAEEVGLRVEVLEGEALVSLHMGGVLAVGRGGSTPPRVVVLEHHPDTVGPDDKPTVLVGKGVVFDSGGYRLKADGGVGMKYDKAGGMAVIATLAWAARTKLNRRVIGVVPLVENMIDAIAFRPDDILTMANGVTVEITNTDAEGRLILADALAYATQRWDCAAVVDIATLTGGVVVALGRSGAGLWCNHAELTEQLLEAGTTSGERLWALPLWHEHREQMKGQHADLINSSPKREAHPIQGAAFLSYFVGSEAATRTPTSVPWAHLDIAGTARSDTDLPLWDQGPTGAGVRLLATWLEHTG